MASHAIFSFPRFLRSTTGFRNIFTSIESFCIDSNTKEIPPFLTILPKEDAHEIGRNVMLTCEHASNRLPKPFQWSERDKQFAKSHWGFDPGAAELTQEIASLFGCSGILSNFTRLLVDPNRPLGSTTLFRDHADGEVIDLNSDMTEADRNWRLWHYYIPYHLAMGKMAQKFKPKLVISIHSFNPIYEGESRDFELGVLCTHDNVLALQLTQSFKDAGFTSRINQPWSGHEGFMFAADSLAISDPGNRTAIMIEARNDKASDKAWREKVAQVLFQTLEQYKNYWVHRVTHLHIES